MSALASGPRIRDPVIAEAAGVHRGGGDDAGDRHRRDRRDSVADPGGAVQAAAIPRSRAADAGPPAGAGPRRPRRATADDLVVSQVPRCSAITSRPSRRRRPSPRGSGTSPAPARPNRSAASSSTAPTCRCSACHRCSAGHFRWRRPAPRVRRGWSSSDTASGSTGWRAIRRRSANRSDSMACPTRSSACCRKGSTVSPVRVRCSFRSPRRPPRTSRRSGTTPISWWPAASPACRSNRHETRLDGSARWSAMKSASRQAPAIPRGVPPQSRSTTSGSIR